LRLGNLSHHVEDGSRERRGGRLAGLAAGLDGIQDFGAGSPAAGRLGDVPGQGRLAGQADGGLQFEQPATGLFAPGFGVVC
jgi:hypothetical protein